MNREILPVAIILLMFAIALYADPMVKADEQGRLIGHWGLDGKPDGMVSKAVGIYLVPVLTLVIYLGLLLIPKIEVYTKNLEEFSDQFWGFKVVLVFVMGVIYVATLLPNLGYGPQVDPVVVIVAAIAMLFFYVGYMLNFTKRNYFIGVRTPWTLADERVWDKTNKLAGKLFWICGALALVSLVAVPDLRLWIVLVPAVLVAIGVSLYSLLEYRKARQQASRPAKKRGKKK